MFPLPVRCGLDYISDVLGGIVLALLALQDGIATALKGAADEFGLSLSVFASNR